MKIPLRFENLEQRRMLHGSDAASATPADVGAATVGQLESESDQDWFVLDANAGTSYMVKVDGASISLTDADGKALQREIGGLDNRPYSTPEDESVYVIVSGGAEYTLTIESYADDHGNTFASATDIELGQSFEGTIERLYEFDYFKLNATAGTTYVIPFEAPQFKYAAIYSRDGVQLASSLKNDWLAWTAATDTEAFVIINGQEGDYQFDVLDLATDDEIGNDLASAVELELGQTIASRIDAPNDTDWFVVSGEVGELITIDHTRSRSQLRIYLPDGTLYSDQISTVRIPSGGQFYVELVGRNSSFDYEITAYRLQQGGSSTQDAVTIPIGSTVAGQHQALDDEGWFTFNAEAGKDYHIRTTRGKLLINAAGESTDTRFFRSTVDQQVYIITSGSGGEYRLSLREVVDDFTNEAATATDVLSRQSGELTIGDEDWFRFEPTPGITYRFRAFDSDLSLWNDAGDQIDEEVGEYVAWTAESDTPIFIRVTLQEGETRLIPYVFFIQDVAEIDDHGNGPDEATRRTLSSTARSSYIDIPGDTDWFVFSVEADSTYRFHAEGLPVLRVYDADGATLINEVNSPDDGVLFLDFDSHQDIFVEVSGDTHAQRYTLIVDEFADDYGNHLTSATSIPNLPTQIQGNVDIAGDIDFFSFEAKAGDWIIAETSSASFAFFDGRTRILNDAGLPLPDRSSSYLRYSTIITEDGTYFIKVTSDKSEDYLIDLRLVTDDHGNTAALSTPIAETPINGKIDQYGDEDWFSFTAFADRSYVVDTDTNGLALQMYDSNGDLVSDTEGDAIIRFSQNTDLDIRLLSKSHFRASYSLSVLEYEDDHAHTMDAATSFSDTLVQTGTLEGVQDKDMFSFDAEAGKSYYVSVTPSFVTLKIQNETTQFGETSSANNAIPIASPTAQTFFLETSMRSNSGAVDYEISVHVVGENDDHSDDPANGTAIQLGLAVNGISEYPLDEDFFSFEAQPGISYTVEGIGIERVRALDASGELLTQTLLPTPGRSFDVASPQTVSIGVGSSGDDRAYSLTVLGYADDHGESLATATSLSIDQSITGKLETRVDGDLFRLEVKAGQSYQFTLTQDDPNDGAALRLFDGNMNHIHSDVEKIVWTQSKDETLFLRVYNTFSAQGLNSYELLAQDFSALDDHGSGASSATSIELDQTVSGTVAAWGDDDWFTVAVEPNTQYIVRTTDSLQVTILGEDGETVLRSFTNAPVVVNSKTNDQLFLRLPGFQPSDYELTIRGTSDDHGDDISTATDISINELLRGGIQIPGDVDFFRVATDTPGFVILDIDLKTLDDAIFRIRDETGRILTSSFVSVSHQQRIRVPSTESYFVEIGGWNAIGEYDLTLRSDQLRIDQLCSRLAADEFDEDFDLVADGRLDQLDVDAMIRDEMGTYRGDIDLNREVNFADFLMLTSRFGETNVGWSGGDFDCSGDVGFADFLNLSKNFGKGLG